MTKLTKNARTVRSAASKGATATRKALAAQASKRRGSRTSTEKASPPKRSASQGAAPKRTAPVRAMTFDLPCGSTQKPPRPNSKRAKVLSMLQGSKGATHAEVMKAIGWDRVTAYEGIRLLSIHNGYGLRQTGERIHAYVEAKKTGRRTAKAS
jgi:hypothetical protein